MGRSPCCEKEGMKKGPWTPEEDQKLLAYIEEHGHGSWRALPAKAGLQRCGKSCRLRWTNYLRPDIKRGKFSFQEEQTIIKLHALLGNRWSAIATHLPQRTDNEIKNLWNTHLKKRLTKMGIDPVTHKPKSDTLGPSTDGHSKSAANLSHMAQWESARLEAEARLARESKLQAPSSSSSSAPTPSLEVLRAWQGLWSKPMSNGIDMESPTSTSSFSETLPGFSIDAAMFDGEAPWVAAPPSIGAGPTGDDFGTGFTEMLMRSSNEQDCDDGRGVESENAEGGGSCVEEGEGEEENKNYWSSILNLVNSSSPSKSPPVF